MTISRVVKEVKSFGIPIVVDDGSKDDTAELATSSGAVVVSHIRNKGYDSALNSGFVKAEEMGLQVVITLDGDGQHNPALISQFISAIDLGADIVIGIRNYRQRLAENLFSMYTRFRFGIKDPLCGMKAYKIEVYKDLGYFDSYNSIGTELMLYSVLKGCCIQQINFKLIDRCDTPRFGSLAIANWKIFRAMVLSFFILRKKRK